MFSVLRLDANRANYTYGKWTRMCDFDTHAEAFAFVLRAACATQRLKIAENYSGYHDPRTHQED